MKSVFYFLLIMLSLSSCNKSDDDIVTEESNAELTLKNLKQIQSNIPKANYTDLAFINETTGFAITQGFIVKTTDGGFTWNKILLPTEAPLKKIQFTDDKNGYIIGGDNTYGILLKTIDGGQNWVLSNLDTQEGATGMFFINKDVGFITGLNLFSKTTDGGQNWTSIKSDGFKLFVDVNFKNANEGYATSDKGECFKTVDGGVTWQILHHNASSFLYDIYFAGNKTLVVNSAESMLDVENAFFTVSKPENIKKMIFFNASQSIAVGYHYVGGFNPQHDILITNDTWVTNEQVTYTTHEESTLFSAMGKMSKNKVMILGTNYKGTRVLIFTK